MKYGTNQKGNAYRFFPFLFALSVAPAATFRLFSGEGIQLRHSFGWDGWMHKAE